MTSCQGARRSLSSKSHLVFIDGHNLLFALRERFAEHLEEGGHPGRAAREALVEAMLSAFGGSGRFVRIYFDGSKPHREQRSEQVEVIYPGGTSDQCADRAILRDLAGHVRENPGAGATAVTRDIRLAKRARKRGAAVVDPAEFFEVWLGQRES